ncbi:dna replication regulator sld3 [Trichoderma arundinaceum]|uniref:Dna replication regulator sld3 n=1 Tax=Trichoderma arundinaceum TaxID=490622 RepID=A0A395NV92_TRIAR|nr:dna replication regulator sld3 [Trichoderma arundinaceum]
MSSSAFLDLFEDASRARSGILTPTSEGSLNRQHGASSPRSDARKSGVVVTMEQLLKPSIAVKVNPRPDIFEPHPPNLHIPPRVLHPLMLLPREHLPLAYIDFAASNGDFPQSQFYESYIHILDLESRLGPAPIVLIARNELRGTTYALERQSNGLYVLCKLGSWADLGSLAQKATAVRYERLFPVKTERAERPDVDALTTPQLHVEQKKKRAAIEAIQSQMRKRVRSQSVSTVGHTPKEEQPLEPESLVSQLPSPDMRLEQVPLPASEEKKHTTPLAQDAAIGREPESHQSAEDIFEGIRTHYFDALYKSMGSLAYFAKGPLSRARSTFHLDLESTLDMADLVEFLKSLILTTVQIDKKYRESVPEIIAKLKDRIESSDEGRKRKRKPKRMKLGKSGLYPLEDESVMRWWAANKPEPNDEAPISSSQIKSHVSILRTRETKLQMILIMEILALEPLKAAGETGEMSLPSLPGAADSEDLLENALQPAPKKRNKHNLPVLLDVHADRLTIWQSTASDEQLLLEDTPSLQTPLDGNLEKKASSEPLRDFCVDVIVPFFSARLPDVCDSINRKLGGPVVIAPAKARSMKKPSSMRNQRPGAAAKRPQPPNARRTLQRALSTEQQSRRSISRGPSSAIALLRSATSTTLPSIKRESLDPSGPMSLLPLDSQRRTHSLSRSSSMNNLFDARASKKAEVDAELKEAISALRKPNREVVGKAMAEADERRTSASLAAKKLKRAPVRSSLASAVQVKATPANNRFKNMMPAKSFEEGQRFTEGFDELIPPSSVAAFVPSTGKRPALRELYKRSPSPAIDAIGDTPIKTSAKPSFIRRPANEQPAYLPSSPAVQRKGVSEDFVITDSAVKPTRTRHEAADLMETPIKKTTQQRIDLYATPEGKSRESKGKSVSIFERLGWDDDFDDL